MNTSDTVARQARPTRRSSLDGAVFLPRDDGYDDARSAWNLAADQRPAMVAFAESADDVVRAVQFARAEGLRIAPQGSGHASTALESLEDAMLLKTSRMRHVDVDAVSRTARAEAGAEWQDVAAMAGEHGLAGLAGSSPNVGVTGYTMGGGIGWLARRYGLAANSVTAVEIVTPESRLIRVDARHEPDLFWALRGGGGSVGVVTALEMRLYQVPDVFAGALFFPIERSAEVLHAWRAWTATVPDEVTSVGQILRVPPLPDVPEALRGGAFAVVEAACLGDGKTGADLVQPLRALGPQIDTFATIPATELQHLHMDPESPAPVVGTGALLADAPADAIDAWVGVAGSDVDTRLVMVELRHLGGALAREAPGAGALPKVDGQYLLYAGGVAATPELDQALRSELRAVDEALGGWRAEHGYYNFLDTEADADAVFPRSTYRRLQEIKATYDPDDTIISAHPVRPAI